MNKCQHPFNNFVLGAPPGMTHEQCTALAVTKVIYEEGTLGLRSYWKPTPEELATLNTGGYICLEILGGVHPPVILTADK